MFYDLFFKITGIYLRYRYFTLIPSRCARSDTLIQGRVYRYYTLILGRSVDTYVNKPVRNNLGMDSLGVAQMQRFA